MYLIICAHDLAGKIFRIVSLSCAAFFIFITTDASISRITPDAKSYTFGDSHCRYNVQIHEQPIAALDATSKWATSEAAIAVREMCGSEIINTWAVPAINRLGSVTTFVIAVKTKAASERAFDEFQSFGPPLLRDRSTARAFELPIGNHRSLAIIAEVTNLSARYSLRDPSMPKSNIRHTLE